MSEVGLILTQVLVYTGVPRGRDWLTVVETGKVVTREVMRVSDLGRLP